MGRTLTLHAVRRDVAHEPGRRICMGWEYERTPTEFSAELHAHLHPGEDWDYSKTTFRNENACYSHNPRAPYDVTPNPDWCNRCRMFAEGLYAASCAKESDGSIVLDSISFRHPYTNPVWASACHFSLMYPGQPFTDFCKRFSSDKMYRELHAGDAASMREALERFGRAYTTADREAAEETQRVIAFCEKWLPVEGVAVIYEDVAPALRPPQLRPRDWSG